MNEILKEIIKQSGLKPSEVADKCGIKRPQMYRWLSKKTKNEIKFDKVIEIADCIGVNVKIKIESKNK